MDAVTSTSRLAEFRAGIRTLLPVLLGVVPSALITGAATSNLGIAADIAIVMSFWVFAGSVQLIAPQLIPSASPAPIILLTTLILSVRLLIYSASIAPHIQHLPKRWKALIAYLLTDPVYAIAITRYARNDASPNKHWFYLGAGCALWAGWQIGIAAGLLLGLHVPTEWSLDFAIPLTFIALIVPALNDRALAIAALAGGVSAVLLAELPYRLSIPIAALIGMLVALMVESRSSSSIQK